MAKNITIRLSDETAHWVRVKAAEDNTSVSRLVGQILQEKMRLTDQYWRSFQEWQQLMARIQAEGSGVDASQRCAVLANRASRQRRRMVELAGGVPIVCEADHLLSEDLQAGRQFGACTVLDPFAADPAAYLPSSALAPGPPL